MQAYARVWAQMQHLKIKPVSGEEILRRMEDIEWGIYEADKVPNECVKMLFGDMESK